MMKHLCFAAVVCFALAFTFGCGAKQPAAPVGAPAGSNADSDATDAQLKAAQEQGKVTPCSPPASEQPATPEAPADSNQ